MATFIAVICLLTIVICVPLVFIRPKWVFYIFLVSVTFSNIFAGYIFSAGNLGMPRTWTPPDALAWLTLAAALFVPKERQYRAGMIGKCFIILAIITAFSLFQGLLMNTQTAFTYSRVAHFVAAMIFSLRYFTNHSRVDGFLKFSAVMLLVMFIVHVPIRLGVYTPRVSEIETSAQMLGERGTYALVPLLYLAMISIAIGRLVSKVGFAPVSILLLLVGISGVVLSETRSTYGAMAVLVMASFLFIRGRFKVMLALGIVGVLVVGAATATGYDFMERFRAGTTRSGSIEIPKPFQKGTWRALENQIIINSYKQQPFFILTGRGIGALHPAPAGKDPMVGFYHSEYLGWLDRCGLIGLAAVLILFFVMLAKSFYLSRSDIPYLRYYGVTCFLLTIALAADGFFHPIFSNPRAAPLLICFAAIVANWQEIYVSLNQEQEEQIHEEAEEYAELTYA